MSNLEKWWKLAQVTALERLAFSPWYVIQHHMPLTLGKPNSLWSSESLYVCEVGGSHSFQEYKDKLDYAPQMTSVFCETSFAATTITCFPRKVKVNKWHSLYEFLDAWVTWFHWEMALVFPVRFYFSPALPVIGARREGQEDPRGWGLVKVIEKRWRGITKLLTFWRMANLRHSFLMPSHKLFSGQCGVGIFWITYSCICIGNITFPVLILPDLLSEKLVEDGFSPYHQCFLYIEFHIK